MALRSVQLSNDQYELEKKRKERMARIGQLVTKEQVKNLGDFLDIITRDSSGNEISLAVAAMNSKDIGEVLSAGTKIISTIAQGYDREAYKEKRFKSNINNLREGYQELVNSGFFEKITEDKEEGKISFDNYENLPGYQIHQSNEEAKAAISNIRDKGGSFIAYDLETTGGRNVGEINLPGHITEFSFIKHNKDGSLDNYTSIIGSTEEETREYIDILKKWAAGTKSHNNNKFLTEGLSDQEIVTLKRLAKMGHLSTSLDTTFASEGIYTFKTFASSQDVNFISLRDIENGIKLLREIGQQQKLAGNDIFKYGDKEYEVKGWEKTFLEGIKDVYEKGLTLVGQNSRTFDLPFLNRMINEDKVSEGFKAALSEMTGKKSPYLEAQNHLDMLPLLRQFLREDFYSEDDLSQMGKLGLSRNTLEAVTRRLTAKEIRDEQGNFIRRDWSDTAYERAGKGAAHMAQTDVEVTIKTVNQLLFDDTDNAQILEFRKRINEAKDTRRKISKDSVLFAKNHFEPQNYDLIQFMQDKLTGEFRTHDSLTVDDEEAGKSLFGQFGIQKGVLYNVEDIREIETDKTYSKAIRKMYPNMDLSKIAVIKLNPIVKDSGQNIRSQSPVYYFGNKEKLLHALLDNTLYVGQNESKDGQISINAKRMTDFTKGQLTRYYEIDEATVAQYEERAQQTVDNTISGSNISDDDYQQYVQKETEELLSRDFGKAVSANAQNVNGKHIRAKAPVDKEGYLSQDFIEESSRRALEESAARSVRDHEFKKDKQILEFLDVRDKLLSGERPEDFTEEEFEEIQKELGKFKEDRPQALLSMFWENSLKSNPTNLQKKASLRRFFGFGKGDTKNIYSETLSKQTAKIDYVDKNRDTVEAAIKAAEIKGSSEDAKDFYYKRIMEALEHKVELSTGSDRPSQLGWKNTGMLGYDYEEKFDIDLTGFEKLPEKTIATIDLSSQPESIINRIFSAGKANLPGIDDLAPAEKSAILRKLQKFITDPSNKFGIRPSYWRKDLDKTFAVTINGDDSLMVASQKFHKMLTDIRTEDPEAGHLKGTVSHTLDISKDAYKIEPKENIEAVIRDISGNLADYRGIFSTDRYKDKELIDNTVDEVIEDIVMPASHDDELERLAKEGHYNSSELESLKFIREQHKKGARAYLSAIIDMTGQMGGQFLWDTDTKKMFSVFAGKAYELDIPREKIVSGQFQWQIGNSLLSQDIGFYETSNLTDDSDLMFGSKMEAVIRQKRSLIDWHIREARTGYDTPAWHLQKMLSDINKELRKSPAVDYVSRATRANQFRVDFEDIYKHIDRVISGMDLHKNKGAIKTDDSYAQILLDILDGKEKYNPENPEYHHVLALNANADALLRAATQVVDIPDKETRDRLKEHILDKLDISIKPAKKHRAGYAAAQVGDWYTQFNYTRRDPANIEDVVRVDISHISEMQKKFLANQKGTAYYLSGIRDIEFGKALTNETNLLSSTYSEIGEQLDTHFRMRSIHMASTTLAAVRDTFLTKAKEKLKEDAAATDDGSIHLLESMMPEEGVGFVHGHVFDQVFSARNSIQKLSLAKTVDQEGNRLLDLDKKQVLDARVLFDDNGNVTGFRYAKGQYVSHDEVIGHIPGFGDRPLEERAKYEGLLKFGFFSRETGQLVSEKQITEIIRNDLDFQKKNSEEVEARSRRIMNLLQNKFMASYYVQTLEANTLFKMNEFTEKGMHRALINATGSVDKDVEAVLTALGFQNPYDHTRTETLNRLETLEEHMIRTIVGDNGTLDLDSDFWRVAKGRYQKTTGKELTDEKIGKILLEKFNPEGDKSVATQEAIATAAANFQRAIREERYGATRLMDTILTQAGIRTEDESWHTITNFAEGHLKHNDIDSVRALLDETLFRKTRKYLASVDITGMAKRGEFEQIKTEELKAKKKAAEDTKQLFAKYFLKAGESTDAGRLTNKDEVDDILQVTNTGRLVLKDDAFPALQEISSEKYKVYGLNLLSESDLNNWLIDIGVMDKSGQREDQVHMYFKKEMKDNKWTGKILGATAQEFADDPGNVFEGFVSKASVEVSRNSKYWENTKEADDAVKLNQRAITNLGNMRVGKKVAGNVQDFLTKRAEKFGTEGDMTVFGEKISAGDIYQKLIALMEEGSVVQSAALDQIKRRMFDRAGGGPKLSGYFTGENGEIVWGIDTREMAKFIKSHNVGGGDIEKGTSIMTHILTNFRDNMKITTVNVAGAENALNVYNAANAVAFNAGNLTIEEAQKVGFETIKLSDIIAGKRGTQFFDESLYTKNYIIDLDYEGLNGLVYRNEKNLPHGGRLVAISANPQMGDPASYIEELPNKPQEQVKALLTNIAKYAEASQLGFTQSSGSMPGQEERLRTAIMGGAKAIRDAQFDLYNSKTGVTAEATTAYMMDASRNTARGMNIMGSEGTAVKNLGELVDLSRTRGADISKLSVFGINLTEEARKGANALQLNYSILSLQRMNKIYDTNFLEMERLLGDTPEAQEILEQVKGQTLNIVQTEGVSSISYREPQQYPTSVSQRQVFFSDIAQGNEVISEMTNAQMRKEDFDADAVGNGIHKEDAAIRIGNSAWKNMKIDSAMWQALKNTEGIEVKLLDDGAEKRFLNYAQSQIYIGGGEAQRFRYISDIAQKVDVIDDFKNSHLLKSQIESYGSKLSDGTRGNLFSGTNLENVLFKAHSTPGERIAAITDEDMAQYLRNVYRDAVAGAMMDKEKYGADFAIASGEVQRSRLWEQLGEDAENSVLGRAIAFSVQDKILSQDLTARASFAPTGRVNRYIQSVYDISQAVLNSPNAIEGLEKSNFRVKDPGILAEQINMVGLMIQEGFMTPKNQGAEVGGETLESMQSRFVPRLEKAMTRMFALGDTATDSERSQLKQELFDIFNKIRESRENGRELTRNPEMPTPLEYAEAYGNPNFNFAKYYESDKTTLSQTGKEAVQNFVDFLTDHIAYNMGSRRSFDLATVGNKGMGKYPPTLVEGTEHTPTNLIIDVVNATNKNMGVSAAFATTPAMGIRGASSKQLEIDEARASFHRENNPEKIVNSISSAAAQNAEDLIPKQQVAKMAHGRGLMGAAIGIAGGLLISGFAGNPAERPPKQYPPQQVWGNAPIPDSALPPAPIDQAADSSWMYGQQYPMTLSDSGISMNSNPPIVGYNINISGMSPRGEAAAQRAIGSALSHGMPQNSSVNVAVHNNYQDTMSQYQVNRMVQTSFGF